jgi:DNA-binding transcriptional LysR family regulator
MAKLDWYIRANLKFRHLQLLKALDELRHIGRAASHLNVSQPAVSKALSQLELSLGHPVFDRKGHRLVPTEHGEVLLHLARDVLDRLAVAREELRDINEGKITRISLGVLPSAAISLVPNFIAKLEAASSDVAANVHEGVTSALLPLLRAGEVDFVIGVAPERPMGTEFNVVPLYEQPTVIVVRAEHPLTRQQPPDWPMLSDYPMMLPSQGTTVRYLLDNFMAKKGISPSRRSLESMSMMTIMGVLQTTDSIGFLTQDLASYLEKQGSVQVLDLVLPVSVRVGLISMADRRMAGAHQLIIRLLRETAAETWREPVEVES